MTLGRTLLIVNPAANHGETGRLLPEVREAIGDLFPYDIAMTESPRHASEIAELAAGYDAIVAVGGDGAVHEVLNGIMRRPPEDRPVLGIIPTGTGNDYCCRTLGFSRHPVKVVRQLAENRRSRVDCGRMNDVWFANSVGIGFDAEVTARAAEMKRTSRLSGILLYLAAVLDILFHRLRPHPVALCFDEGDPRPYTMLFVASTIGPTYGGGFTICPDASPTDGLLEVCLIDPLGPWDALWRLPFFVFGKHTRMRPAHMSRNRTVLVESDEPLLAELDGEVLQGRRFELRCHPAAVEVLVP